MPGPSCRWFCVRTERHWAPVLCQDDYMRAAGVHDISFAGTHFDRLVLAPLERAAVRLYPLIVPPWLEDESYEVLESWQHRHPVRSLLSRKLVWLLTRVAYLRHPILENEEIPF